MKRIFALILGFTVSLQCVGYAAELDSTINSEAIPDEAATASFNEVSQETEDVVLSEDTVNEAAEEMESEIGISEAEIAEESVLTATESVEALQLFGTETDAEKSITNPKTMFYFNDYNTAGQYDFLSTYNINAVKGYNTEKGSVLSLSALSGGVYGDAVYEIGSITDVWDGATRDTSWYDAMDTTFEISSAAALAGLSKLVQDGITFEGKTLTLKCNVDLNNKEWTPIGGSSYKFKGTFDGDGNEIKNLKIAKSYGGGYVGVFGYIEGKLSNLGVNGAEVQVTSTSTGKLTMAALAAQLTGTIESCYAKNTSLRLLRSDDKEATQVLDLIAPVVASLGKGSTMNSCYSTNLYIYSSWGALTGGIFSLSFGESSAKNTINNCYTGGSCVVETNPKTGNAVRYYPMGAKNTSANTSGSKNICGHTTTLFKGDKATYGNVYSELAPNTATEETLKNSVSDLGALYEADTYYSNDGFPVLQSQRTPIDDAMNIAFDVMVPIGSDAELVLYAGKEEAGTLKLGSIAAGAWSSLELILKEGVYTPIVNGVSQGSNNLTSQNHTVSAFAFRVYGNDILLDNLMIYKDNQELLGAKLDALETLVVSQMQEYPKLSENLSLVSEFEGCQVKWQSSNPSVLSDTGEILAQKNCSIPVTMTAEVKLPRPHEDYDAATAEIAFPIQIAPAEGADAAAVVDDILEYLLAGSNITEEVWHKISKNLKTLPAAWDGASITWESSDASVMETNGTVHILESENKEVTLTAVVILDGVRQSKELNFTVLSANTMLTEAMNAITYTDLTDEEWQNLTKDLTLPDTGLYGTKIIWSSDCPQLVTDKGYVMEIVDDTYVTMTAEFEILGYTQIKTFPFVAKLSASKKIETDMSGITLPTETDTDFSVPVQGETYESVISWSCNSPYVTINSGKVQITRPEHETGNVEVVLVAKFENGGTEISKEYTVTVLCLPTDEILLQNELDALTFADISYEKDLSAIKNDLHLKTSFPYDIQYTWTSTEPEVVTMDGKVIRPAIGEADVPVTLTLTIERGGVIKSKPFPFKVKAYGSTEEVLEQASALLTFRTLSQEPINLISKNLFLPKSWKYGTEITWDADNDMINIEEDGEHYIGVVNRPDFGTENLTVTLTATIAYQGQSAEKRFYLSVAEKDGNVSVVYEDFDSLSIDSTFTESVDGKIAHKNKNQITTIVPDPMDATNPVLKFEKTTDLPWVSSGSDATMNSSIPTLSRAGDFQMKFRLYIEKMSNLRFRITAPFVGEGLEEIDIFIESDGTFYQKNTGNKASKKLSIGQWNDVSIEFSTYSNTLDIYLNGELVLDNAPFSYSSGSTEVSAMKFKFVPPAGSSDGVATDTHTVYIDEMKILRMVDYSGEIAEAMEQLELQFLAAQNINAIAKDVVIPDLSQYAVTVSTSSSNPDVVANDGTVTRGNADTEINYTITLSNEYGGTRSRTFKLLVKNANYNSDDAGGTVDDAVAVLYDAKQAVENLEATYSLNYITGNLNLPKAGVNGSRLSWKSMNTDVLSDSGVVTRKDEDTEVTLFLTATLNGVSERIGIELIVKAAATSGNITGGGGGMATGSGANNISSFVSAEERTDAVKEETASSFVDVENHWAKAYIQKLYELKIVNGITETTFAPDLTITREAFVTMLMRMLGYEYSDQTLRFYDVDANEWYYPYVMAAYDAGIVYGISESEFGVGRNITRQDLCTMIARAIEMQGVETDSDERQAFKDAASIDDYAKEAVYSLRNLEIISGKGENCFDPRGEATRAETAKIIAGLVDIIAVTKGQE